MDSDLELYYWLKLTREFEYRVSRLHAQNKISGGVYSGFGQEAVVVGTTYGLQREDVIFPLHRDLGALLVKGVPPGMVMAQLYGKATGLARGKDSGLHGGLLSQGVFGSTSMLASSLPVACGFALKFKLRREPRVCVAYFGEGAGSRGDFHEAANFAGVHKLPVLFVCENNQYAYSTPLSQTMAIENVADRAAAYGFKGQVVDGNDLFAVLEATAKATARARAGEGPTLIEAKTYRMLGHSPHDRASYRIEQERKRWEARDPLRLWESYLQVKGVDLEKVRAETEARIKAVVDEAVKFAEESPDPSPEDALTDIYATAVPGVPQIRVEPREDDSQEVLRPSDSKASQPPLQAPAPATPGSREESTLH
ncbi:MAG: thiamine pyrophosphate-dependent dehydrogenase E1 component subunit alpha [Deltaproteobacteria bacterium]|nr:thiamine pyrophosphate-dependent dehydrogenase E1 component subunit alpha [Deltaproteobacteria bacterium]